MEYVPYGKEWQAMLKRRTIKELFDQFGIEKEGLNKTDYILKIKEELLFRRAQLGIK